MNTLLYTSLFLPLAGFLTILLFSAKISRLFSGLIACSALFLSFIGFVALLINYEHPATYVLYQWIPINSINADFALHLDELSLLMALIITGVGFLIHVYSIGYMEHDEDHARYFACLNLFVFAMLLLVLAANLLLLFVGWEGVGLASYLLIGYYYHRPSAAQAATKAFVVNRIGDCGFLIGLLLTFTLFGTSDVDQMVRHAAAVFALSAPLVTVLTALLFVGATGKSAQLPLHTWLPDAMEGPTPVSALIHAATMVTAGVYLIVRLHVLYQLSPYLLYTIGLIGGITSLFAALSALGQTDLKRVLAYSTVSQLGLMFLACGASAFYAAMFHLTTHAFVKALLFLSAGNVVHMLNGTTNMENMGGLASIFYRTRWLFLLGVLAMSGIPPLAAFFSKDIILEQEHLAGFDLLFYLGLTTSFLTGIYLTRAYCLTFTGAPRLQPKILRVAKEAPLIMLVPVMLLGVLTLVGGFLGFTFGQMPLLEAFLAKIDIRLAVEEPTGLAFLTEPATLISMAIAFVAVFGTMWFYANKADRLKEVWPILKQAFYIDQIYDAIIVKPLEAIASWIDRDVEPQFFTRSIDTTAHGADKISSALQLMQSGQLRSYVAWMTLGTVILIAYFTFL